MIKNKNKIVGPIENRSKYEALDVCIEICGEEDKQVRESREKEVGGQ